MRPKLVLLLIVLVATPLAALGALGAKLVRDERVMAQHRLQELVRSRLVDVDATIQQALDAQARLAESEAPGDLSTESLREAGRDAAHVRQFFVLNAAGELVYPMPGGALVDREREFLERSRELWRNPLQVVSQPEAAAEQQATRGASRDTRDARSPEIRLGARGWFTWYWGNGLQFIHWWRAGDVILGAELYRARLVAEIVAALPQTLPGGSAAEGRTVLLDSQGAPVYQWGAFTPEAGASPVVTQPLSGPVASWALASYMPPNYTRSSLGGGVELALGSALAALALAVVGVAIYFYRESSRDLRAAGQRISFVNQVSHELKTPLTNIRLYAELLEEELDEAEGTARRHLHTIVSESQRLSRMIANVLTFSRKGHTPQRIQARATMVDDVVAHLIAHFAESLDQKGITVYVQHGAPHATWIDPDVVEQILGNLLSNVEKYARGADRVEIATSQMADTVTITVTDNGPGVAPRDRTRIFDAFYRASDRLTDGVAGTGIGLTIARELARLHGGDVVLNRTEPGASFTVTLGAMPRGQTS